MALDLGQQVDLEVLAERVRLLNLRRVGGQDEVAHLNAVLGQAVHEVEVEVAQEVREVLLDHVEHAERPVVEGLDGGRDRLAWHHVVLEEAQGVHDQVLDLESLLVEGSISARSAQVARVLEA